MTSNSKDSSEGLKILHAGLFRMGTHSLAQAYRVLGFKTFHALDDPWNVNWVKLEEAAEATWPTVPNARPSPPFTRDDWDALWGNEYEAVCDTSAPFTLQLFRAYPDAKVVIVQRDFDTWWPSFQSEVVDNLFKPFFELQIALAWYLVGFRAGHAMRKLVFGFFDAKNKKEIKTHGRQAYERFYKELRDNVPAGQLLEYKLGSGWEPLCEFLGREVPDVPFPVSNERDSHAQDVDARRRKVHHDTAKAAVLGILSLIAVGASWWLL
jgi:hypothetical protein